LYLYKQFVHPTLTKHEPEIDAAIDDIGHKARKFSQDLKRRSLLTIRDSLSRTLTPTQLALIDATIGNSPPASDDVRVVEWPVSSQDQPLQQQQQQQQQYNGGTLQAVHPVIAELSRNGRSSFSSGQGSDTESESGMPPPRKPLKPSSLDVDKLLSEMASSPSFSNGLYPSLGDGYDDVPPLPSAPAVGSVGTGSAVNSRKGSGDDVIRNAHENYVLLQEREQLLQRLAEINVSTSRYSSVTSSVSMSATTTLPPPSKGHIPQLRRGSKDLPVSQFGKR
jgi:type III secretion system FlhB-like substrate exporter